MARSSSPHRRLCPPARHNIQRTNCDQLHYPALHRTYHAHPPRFLITGECLVSGWIEPPEIYFVLAKKPNITAAVNFCAAKTLRTAVAVMSLAVRWPGEHG